MTHITRRRFLEDSLLSAAAACALPSTALAFTPRRKVADPLRVAVIGVRGRGRAHIKAFRDSAGAEVVALCDPDEGVLGPAQKAVPQARFERDLRKLLEDDSIDAVSIATPNHWHSLAAVWALQAGKHVYVEKPLSHNFNEGRALVEAARATGLVVQHGTQARSYPATRQALAWLQNGGLGRVKVARGLCYKRRDSIGKVDGPQTPPATLDYDLWTGPAELRPLLRKRLHYDWHWDFNTGNGDLGNQGVHQMDIARWGLGQDGFPQRIVSLGGRVGYVDDGDTPNTQITLYDYGEQQLIFEVRGLPTPDYRGAKIGVVFDCEDGYLVSASYGKVVAYDNAGKEVQVFTGEGNHFENFIDAARAGAPGKLTAKVEDGHISSGLCHLGNVSYKLAESRALSAKERPFGDDALGQEAFERMCAHFADYAPGAAASECRIGPQLTFDGANELFRGDHADQANALLGREARAPFSFPKLG